MTDVPHDLAAEWVHVGAAGGRLEHLQLSDVDRAIVEVLVAHRMPDRNIGDVIDDLQHYEPRDAMGGRVKQVTAAYQQIPSCERRRYWRRHREFVGT